MNKTILNKLIKAICKAESGKKEFNAGVARKAVKVFATLLENDAEFRAMFIAYSMSVSLNKKS